MLVAKMEQWTHAWARPKINDAILRCLLFEPGSSITISLRFLLSYFSHYMFEHRGTKSACRVLSCSGLKPMLGQFMSASRLFSSTWTFTYRIKVVAAKMESNRERELDLSIQKKRNGCNRWLRLLRCSCYRYLIRSSLLHPSQPTSEKWIIGNHLSFSCSELGNPDTPLHVCFASPLALSQHVRMCSKTSLRNDSLDVFAKLILRFRYGNVDG
jgi:hypothetical protein